MRYFIQKIVYFLIIFLILFSSFILGAVSHNNSTFDSIFDLLGTLEQLVKIKSESEIDLSPFLTPEAGDKRVFLDLVVLVKRIFCPIFFKRLCIFNRNEIAYDSTENGANGCSSENNNNSVCNLGTIHGNSFEFILKYPSKIAIPNVARSSIAIVIPRVIGILQKVFNIQRSDAIDVWTMATFNLIKFTSKNAFCRIEKKMTEYKFYSSPSLFNWAASLFAKHDKLLSDLETELKFLFLLLGHLGVSKSTCNLKDFWREIFSFLPGLIDKNDENACVCTLEVVQVDSNHEGWRVLRAEHLPFQLVRIENNPSLFTMIESVDSSKIKWNRRIKASLAPIDSLCFILWAEHEHSDPARRMFISDLRNPLDNVMLFVKIKFFSPEELYLYDYDHLSLVSAIEFTKLKLEILIKDVKVKSLLVMDKLLQNGMKRQLREKNWKYIIDYYRFLAVM